MIGSDGTIYVALVNGTVHAVSSDGTELWVAPPTSVDSPSIHAPLAIGAPFTIYRIVNGATTTSGGVTTRSNVFDAGGVPVDWRAIATVIPAAVDVP